MNRSKRACTDDASGFNPAPPQQVASPWPRLEGTKFPIRRQYGNLKNVFADPTFFASVRVYYEEGVETAQTGTLTFMAKGVRYRVSFIDLCQIYDFHTHLTATSLPTTFAEMRTFWNLFAHGHYDTSGTPHTDIKHPTVRYLARLLANTVLYKNEPGKMHIDELVLMFSCLKEDTLFPTETPLLAVDANLGAVFAHQLMSVKYTPFTLRSTKSFTAGSLLTPIFEFCRIDTSNLTVRGSWTMDFAFLKKATWVEPGPDWVFRDAAREHMVLWPIRELLTIRYGAPALAFQVDPALLR
ncbi:hypothetical protein AALP_AAs66769U000100 [Arabis alpina]|uniref:Arabidopsis retrotransposon Orf1 C-terminal domain-containing protein n=1 Tax=Arabis alpina TaxID=50452 RepID=A0A087FZM5_ARAAL|nr:hypothetical protein AALP_AAs66769U000100 [Arabis alpina]